MPGQVAGFSCCKPFLLCVEIYGCLSLIKMDVLSRLQVSHVSCQMSRSVLKYGGEGRGVEVSSDLGRTTLDNFSFKGEVESHCVAVKLASLNPSSANLEAATMQQPMGYKISWSFSSSSGGHEFTPETHNFKVTPFCCQTPRKGHGPSRTLRVI